MSGALSSNFSQITSTQSNLSKESTNGTQGHHSGRVGTLKNGDIYFAQETHSTPETENLWKEECGCEVFFSHGTSNSCGVMTFFSNKLEIEVTGKITDSEGRFLLLKCIIQGTKFIIYNVYAPNNEKDHEAFLLDLKSKLESLDADEYEYLIGAGDWNFTSEKIDRSGGNYTIWQKNTATLDEINDNFVLIDIWRVKNPENYDLHGEEKKQ